MSRDTSRVAAEEGLLGAGAEGPASKRIAASPEDVSHVVLTAVIKHLSTKHRKALLTSSLLACDAPLAANQQKPCILASAVRGAVGNAIRIIKVCDFQSDCFPWRIIMYPD